MNKNDLIGELDPEQKQCKECKKYKHIGYFVMHSSFLCNQCDRDWETIS